MKIFVCVKQVPDTDTRIKLSADNKSIDLNGVRWIMNPYDEIAVEEGIKMRDACAGSQLLVLCCGPKKRVTETVQKALAMGANEGIIIDAPDFLEPHLVALALTKAIQAEGPAAMIFAGKLAIDDNAASVPQMLANGLQIPHVTVVGKFDRRADSFDFSREIEGGAKEVGTVSGPAVVAVTKGLNTPRYASLPGIMAAKKKPIKDFVFSNLVTSAATTEVIGMRLPPERPPVKQISGDPAAQAAELVRLLRSEAKIL